MASDVTTAGARGGAKRGVGETRALVKQHVKKGLRTREIALLLGISTQSTNQHIARLRELGELPPADQKAATG